MDARKSIGLAFLVVATACTPRGGTESLSPRLAREGGPGAYIQVDYWGGLITRTVDVAFSVDQTAFVLVGHLGGDGVIRVLYPTTPDFGELVEPQRPHKMVGIRPFLAFYDGAPTAYTFRMTPFRSMGARFASYDGAGNGYVFIIASRTPLRYEAIFDGLEWLDVPVRDYYQIADPRLAVYRYAEALVRTDRYTVKFATSMTSQSFASYAANAMDVATLCTLGLNHLQTFWTSWGFGGFGSLANAEFRSRDNFARFGCAPHYASLVNYLGYDDGIPGGGFRGTGFLGYPRQTRPRPIIPTITDPESPVKRRPTYRPFGERATTAAGSSFKTSPRTFVPTDRTSERTSGESTRGMYTRGPGISNDPGFHRAPVTSHAPTVQRSLPSASGGASSGASSRPTPSTSPSASSGASSRPAPSTTPSTATSSTPKTKQD